MNLFSEDAALELLAQQVWRKNVRNTFQKISGVGLTLYAYANFAQPLQPAPNGGTRNANLLGNSFAADSDGGVVGKKRQQRCESAVGSAWQGSGSHGSWA